MLRYGGELRESYKRCHRHSPLRGRGIINYQLGKTFLFIFFSPLLRVGVSQDLLFRYSVGLESFELFRLKWWSVVWMGCGMRSSSFTSIRRSTSILTMGNCMLIVCDRHRCLSPQHSGCYLLRCTCIYNKQLCVVHMREREDAIEQVTDRIISDHFQSRHQMRRYVAVATYLTIGASLKKAMDQEAVDKLLAEAGDRLTHQFGWASSIGFFLLFCFFPVPLRMR